MPAIRICRGQLKGRFMEPRHHSGDTSLVPFNGRYRAGTSINPLSAKGTEKPASFLRIRPTKLSVNNGEKRISGTKREPAITSARCALSLTKRWFNSLFAVNDMNPGRPSAIVASSPDFSSCALGVNDHLSAASLPQPPCCSAQTVRSHDKDGSETQG